jgi:acetyl-CoA/propionyl-CoA carboxylase biotin carboxyl carrier protein
MATALPFHRAVVRDAAFTDEPFRVHTRWIETEWAGGVPPFTGGAAVEAADEATQPRDTVVVEVGGKRLEVSVPAGFLAGAAAPASPQKAARRGGRKQAAAAGGDALVAPMQGTIVKIAVAEGDEVAEGDLIVVLEAMKMEQPINAHQAGVVTGLSAGVGDVLGAGSTICTISAG